MDLFAEVVALTTALDAVAVDCAICGGVAKDLVDVQRLQEASRGEHDP